jgi:hypothetical protein
VIELVEVHQVAAADEPADEAQIGLVAGREDQAVLLAQEQRQRGLELAMEVEGAVQEPAPGAARTVPVQRA